jgi:hypothetical protein
MSEILLLENSLIMLIRPRLDVVLFPGAAKLLLVVRVRFLIESYVVLDRNHPFDEGLRYENSHHLIPQLNIIAACLHGSDSGGPAERLHFILFPSRLMVFRLQAQITLEASS